MPSTHSASMGYYAVYISLACYYLPIHHSLPQSILTRIVPLAIVPWAGVVMSSRVWLAHHTWAQVSAGCAYGSLFAVGVFSLWINGGMTMYGPSIEYILTRTLPSIS
jgi:dolichyldiphosphatase